MDYGYIYFLPAYIIYFGEIEIDDGNMHPNIGLGIYCNI